MRSASCSLPFNDRTDDSNLKTWTTALRQGVQSGSAAGIASAMMLAYAGRTSVHSATAPINAPSRWLWGDPALRARDPSLRHTVIGYAIHHAAAVFWGMVYERFLAAEPPSTLLRTAAGATTTAALACFVDYRLTPRRLQPGFERHLSRPALACVYAALAAGLAASTLLRTGSSAGVPRPVRGHAS